MKKRFTARTTEAGLRLDVVLAKRSLQTRSHLKTHWAVEVNGQPQKPSYPLAGGDKVLYELPEPINPDITPPKLPIIYEDSDLLVVDKPAGVLTHGRPGGTPEPTVVDFAKLHTTDDDPARPGIVHRLDRDTSGLLIIAKTKAAKTALQAEFKARRVQKTYLALVCGAPKLDQATIDVPLARHHQMGAKRKVDSNGTPATTHYTVLERIKGYTLVEAKPKTGRTHQLRVHFAHLGHPIAGDRLYGKGDMPRLCLHAHRLEFTAPSGKTLKLTSPLPSDMVGILDEIKN